MLALWIILGVLLLFILTLLIRTLHFTPHPEEAPAEMPVSFDEAAAIEHMQQLIRCKTESYRDKQLEDDAEFEKCIDLLSSLFPHVYETCTLTRLNSRSLLYLWKGKTSEKPGVLMAHFDVVPVNQADWSKPAYEALIEDGVMWGRGTLDTKGTFLGAMQAADNQIAAGFVPEHDLYLAFGGDEEINGDGAPAIVRYFKENNIHPDFVLDEGGAVVTNVFPGVTKPCAVVGIAEKGMLNVRFTVKSNGGHASTPPSRSSIGMLGRTVKNIEEHPFPYTLTAPALKMFDALARHSGFAYRMIFANLWCFNPVLNLICKKGGGELNALVRTTVAFTQMSGSAAINVLPPEATIGANLRLIPGETMESAKKRLQSLCSDERVTVEVLNGMNPSRVSATDCEPWKRLCTAIHSTWQDAIVSPYLMLACSDSRHYGEISDHVYRFSAMALSKEERGMIHGNDERVPLETLTRTVAFYMRVISLC